MKKAFTYTLIFIGIQFVVGGLVTLAFQLSGGNGTGATALMITSAAASIVTVIVFLVGYCLPSLATDAPLVCPFLVCGGLTWGLGPLDVVAGTDA